MFKSKRTEEKPQTHRVVYRNAHGAWSDEPSTREDALEAFRYVVSTRVITPDNGRRITVLGPDTDRIDDIRDPLPNRGELIEWASALFPALPPLVFPRPVNDPVLDPAPLPSGYVRMDGVR